MAKKNQAIKDNAFTKAHMWRQQELQINEQIKFFLVGDEESKNQAVEMPVITELHIAEQIQKLTGIPIKKLTDSERERMLNLEPTLAKTVIGQSRAINVVSRSLQRSSVGLRNPNRPIASFIFVGLTSVGKTELTKAVA